jgi:hypothetical protein
VKLEHEGCEARIRHRSFDQKWSNSNRGRKVTKGVESKESKMIPQSGLPSCIQYLHGRQRVEALVRVQLLQEDTMECKNCWQGSNKYEFHQVPNEVYVKDVTQHWIIQNIAIQL